MALDRRRTRTPPQCVYFVHAPGSRLLKIGAATDPRARFGILQTGSPEPLRLLGWMESSDARQLERELHQCFGPWRVRGEWFQALPEIVTFALEARDPGTEPENFMVVPRTFDRPAIPPGVDAPVGNSRKARHARYLLARGLTQ